MASSAEPPGAGHLEEKDLHRLAALCQNSARRFFGLRLDFSPASLALADRLISQALEEPQPTLASVLPWGAYLGEVVVRHLGGRWIPHDDVLETAVAVEGRLVLPFRRAAQRLSKGADYALDACYQETARSLPGRAGEQGDG